MRPAVHITPLALAVVVLTLCCAALNHTTAAYAADTVITLDTVGAAPVDLNEPLGFMDAVKVALARSASLRSTEIALEASKLTEKDTWYRLFPKLNLVATYNEPILEDKKNPTDYKPSVNISFNSGSYDPIMAYLSHDASKTAIKLAEVLHIAALEERMGKIALGYLSINILKEEAAYRKELVAELESLEQYTTKKLEAGTIAALDRKLAEQRLNVARKELNRCTRAEALMRRQLKRLIGLDALDNVVFNTDDAPQRLTNIEGAGEALRPETLQKNNLELRAQALREKLESFNIRLAKAEHLPKFSFGLNTPDPLSNQGGNLPYYATFSATMPLWAWGETMRGVERAELRKQDAKAKGRQLLLNIQQNIDDMRVEIQTNEESADLFNSGADLSKLEALRKEIAFNANSSPYEVLINAREAALVKRIEACRAKKSLQEAQLRLKLVTGQLISEHVQVNYGELEKD